MNRSREPRWMVWLVTLHLSVAAPAAAAGQGEPMAQFAPLCPAGHVPVIDTSVVTLGLAPARYFIGPASRERHDRVMVYADAIRSRFVPPATLGDLPMLGEYGEGGRTGRARSRSALSGTISVITRSNGHLKKFAWTRRPQSIELAAALEAAVRAAEDSGDFNGLERPGGAKGEETLMIALVIAIGDGDLTLPLMRAKVPVYVTQSSPSVVIQRPPVYPPQAVRDHAEGDVTASFIVGSDGRVVLSSLQFSRNDWVDFIGPVRASLRGATFEAARSDGCSVAALTSQQFSYRTGVRTALDPPHSGPPK